MDSFQVRELIEFSKASKVRRDEATGEIVVEGVKYLGPKSSNVNPDGSHNEYPLEGRVKSEKLYEGASIYLNHPDRDNPSAERGYEEKLGRLRNTRGRSNEEGSYGDLHLNPKHPLAEQVAWDAEHSPDSLGLSHNAVGVGRVEGKSNKCNVTVTKVRSVDLVAAAATTQSLFESEAPMAETETPKAETPAEAQTAEVEESKKDEAAELRALVEAQKEEILRLKAEAAETAKRTAREKLIAESNLPNEAISDLFREQVCAATDDATAQALIEDRRRILFHQDPSAPAALATTEKTDEDFLQFLRS